MGQVVRAVVVVVVAVLVVLLLLVIESMRLGGMTGCISGGRVGKKAATS